MSSENERRDRPKRKSMIKNILTSITSNDVKDSFKNKYKSPL